MAENRQDNEGYRRFREALPAGTDAASQAEVDRALAELRALDERLQRDGAPEVRGRMPYERGMVALANQRLRVALIQTAGASSAAGHSDVRAYSLNAAARQLLASVRCWPEAQTPANRPSSTAPSAAR